MTEYGWVKTSGLYVARGLLFVVLWQGVASSANPHSKPSSTSATFDTAKSDKSTWLPQIPGLTNENASTVQNSSGACVCLTGPNPSQEIFYRWGCKKWLSENACPKDSKIHRAGTQLERSSKELMKVGYVGHGLGDRLKGLQKLAQGGPLYIDDTSCPPMAGIGEIQKQIRAIDPGSENITYKAVSVTSLGMWDSVLPGKNNVAAIITSTKIIHPNCSEYVGRGCSTLFQLNKSAKCSLGERLSAIQCQSYGIGSRWKQSYTL